MLLADAREPAVANPAVAEAVDVHAALAAPAAEGGIGSLSVLAEIPLRRHGAIVGEGRVVLHVLRECPRVALETATLVLGVELLGRGVVVELEELELDRLTLALGHGVHDRPGRVLLLPGGVECLLRGLVAVDAHDVDGVGDRCCGLSALPLTACGERKDEQGQDNHQHDAIIEVRGTHGNLLSFLASLTTRKNLRDTG